MARAHRQDDLSLRRRSRQPPECSTTDGIGDTCHTTPLLLFQKQCIIYLVLKEKQKMTPVIAPREPPCGAGVTDDPAALMPPGIPPIALFRVLAHNPASPAMGDR
jgi:hypothetical protein